jgi:MFS superfamily sulfate permease-like transporter
MVGWVRSYDRSSLRGDLIAGIAVAALIVPKNLGYAAIAGIPVQNGLYAAAAGAILYAVFGTSRQISTGRGGGRSTAQTLKPTNAAAWQASGSIPITSPFWLATWRAKGSPPP